MGGAAPSSSVTELLEASTSPPAEFDSCKDAVQPTLLYGVSGRMDTFGEHLPLRQWQSRYVVTLGTSCALSHGFCSRHLTSYCSLRWKRMAESPHSTTQCVE